MTFEGRGRYDRIKWQCPGREKGLHKFEWLGVGKMNEGEYMVGRCLFCKGFRFRYLRKLIHNDLPTIEEIRKRTIKKGNLVETTTQDIKRGGEKWK